MTPTERKALEAWNAVQVERMLGNLPHDPSFGRKKYTFVEAMCRLIDEHERYKQDVSHAIDMHQQADGVEHRSRTWDALTRFIIPKPDPVAEWLHKSGYEGNADVEQAVRAFAKERGK